uniref:Uncharacterized protein n=1 Tax=Myotis myotis TaxID=51298 RepID=A0A7J7SC00_MYOMY|nr:hypothetical protein mMyoMyo1_009491 [Myotis myotis]
MDSTQVGVFKQANQIGLTCLLQSTNGRALEAQVCFEVLSNFSHQTLEGKLANEKLSGLLITSNFTKCHGSRPVATRLLHPSGGGHTLPSGFGRQLLPRRFAPGRLAGGLLGTSHGAGTSSLTPLLLRLELGELEAAQALEAGLYS